MSKSTYIDARDAATNEPSVGNACAPYTDRRCFQRRRRSRDGARSVSGRVQTAARRAPRGKPPPALDLDMLLTNARQASEFLKALSHEVRLLILCFLIDGEKSVSEIERLLKLRQPAVSQQLARLRADGLVDTRRNGKNIY